MAIKEREKKGEKPEMTQKEFAEYLEKNTSIVIETIEDFKKEFGYNPFEKVETTQENIKKTYDKNCFYCESKLDRTENQFQRGIFLLLKKGDYKVINIKDEKLYDRVAELFKFTLR